MNLVSWLSEEKTVFGRLGKISAVGVLCIAVLMLMSCKSTSNSDFWMSIDGGYESKTIENDPSGTIIGHRGALIGVNLYYGSVSKSNIFGFCSFDDLFLGDHASDFNALVGFAYMFDLNPMKIMLGGGFYQGVYSYIDADYSENPVLFSVSHYTAGVGLMADIQYWPSDRFFVDLYGSYNSGLIVDGSYEIRYGDYGSEYETFKIKLRNPTYLNVKLGFGFKLK